MSTNRTRDPYEVLGVAPSAAPAEVRAAWLRLCAIYHPDRYAAASSDVRAEALRRMTELNAAYDAIRRGTSRPSPTASSDTTQGQRAAPDDRARSGPASSGRSRGQSGPSRLASTVRARRTAAIIAGAFFLGAVIWAAPSVFARSSATVYVPLVSDRLFGGAWKVTVECNNILQGGIESGSLVQAKFDLTGKKLEGTVTSTAAAYAERDLSDTCAGQVWDRFKSNGVTALMLLGLGAYLAYVAYDRIKTHGRLDLRDALRRRSS